MRQPDNLIFFLRVPKTATSSMEMHFKRGFNYKNVFSVIVPTASAVAVAGKRDAPNAWVISGHYPFGAHEHYDGRSYEYVTVSRDPVDRVTSLFHYCQNPNHSGHRYHNPGLDFAKWLDKVGPNDISETAVRYLSGLRIATSIDAKLEPVTREHLERAKVNLREHFSAVGVVERFGALVRKLEQRYGWPHSQMIGVNGRRGARRVHERKPDRETLPAALVERIDAMNELDGELHAWIKSELAP